MHVSQVSAERTGPSTTRVRELLGRLPAVERDALALARTERLTYREVAVALGISEDTAKRHIRSGLQRLRAEMRGPDAIAS